MIKAERINGLFVLSKSLLKQGEWDRALEVNKRILKLVKRGGPDGRAKAGALTNIGLIYCQKGDIERSISTLEKSLELKKQIGDKRFLVTTLMNLARSYRANCQYENAIECLNQLLDLSRELNDTKLEKEVNGEIVVTGKTKNKEPLFYQAEIGISTDGAVYSTANLEYLPNFFDNLSVIIDEISMTMKGSLEVTTVFHFEDIGEEITDPYMIDKWKVEAKYPQPREEDETPNLVIFLDRDMSLSEKDIRITSEEGIITYDYGRGSQRVWLVFTPNSYPIGGYSPIPKCEHIMFFNGLGHILNWRLDIKTRYIVSFVINLHGIKTEQKTKIGILFPFKVSKIQASGVFIKADNLRRVKKGYLKVIPYIRSKGPVEIIDFFDFTKGERSFEFFGDGLYTLKILGLGGAEMIELRDYRVLCFDVTHMKKTYDLMIGIDEIDSFNKVVEVDTKSIQNLVPLSIREEEVKEMFQQIIGEPFTQKDWPGERSDLFTTHVKFRGRREPAAFIFKGKAFIKQPLTIADLGKRGDQIIRLFTEPAKVYFLQCNGSIDSQVYDMMKTYAERKARQEEIFYCIVDGVDTARVLVAYDKIKR